MSDNNNNQFCSNNNSNNDDDAKWHRFHNRIINTYNHISKNIVTAEHGYLQTLKLLQFIEDASSGRRQWSKSKMPKHGARTESIRSALHILWLLCGTAQNQNTRSVQTKQRHQAFNGQSRNACCPTQRTHGIKQTAGRRAKELLINKNYFTRHACK